MNGQLTGKTKKIAIAIILVGTAVAIFWINRAGNAGIFEQGQKESPKVCLKENCYQVEIAATMPEQRQGLMFRQELDESKGMLFVFEFPGVHNFWMKNTLIPLDIVWFDENEKIIFISPDTAPCPADPCPSFGPMALAKYVLEINAGQIKKIGAQIGDQVIIEY